MKEPANKRIIIQSLVIVLLLLILVAHVTMDCSRTEDGGTEAPTLEPQPIRCLQKALMDLGYDCGKFAPDGVLGNATLASYRHWDKMNAGLVEAAWQKDED